MVARRASDHGVRVAARLNGFSALTDDRCTLLNAPGVMTARRIEGRSTPARADQRVSKIRLARSLAVRRAVPALAESPACSTRSLAPVLGPKGPRGSLGQRVFGSPPSPRNSWTYDPPPTPLRIRTTSDAVPPFIAAARGGADALRRLPAEDQSRGEHSGRLSPADCDREASR
jgi:hypothetical protein